MRLELPAVGGLAPSRRQRNRTGLGLLGTHELGAVGLVVRIGEMIAYQAYNIKSPLDGEAAMWADLNQSELPIDSRAMRPADLE